MPCSASASRSSPEVSQEECEFYSFSLFGFCDFAESSTFLCARVNHCLVCFFLLKLLFFVYLVEVILVVSTLIIGTLIFFVCNFSTFLLFLRFAFNIHVRVSNEL